MSDQPVTNALVIPAGPFKKAAGEQAGPAIEAVAYAEIGFGLWTGGKDILVHEGGFLADNNKGCRCSVSAGKGKKAPRWLFFFAGSTEANPGSRLLGRVQELFQVFKDDPYVLVMLLELAALFDHFLFHPLQLD